MTSATTPNPYVITESLYIGDNRGWKAFDGNSDTGWWTSIMCSPVAWGTPCTDLSAQWINIDFGQDIYVLQYSISAYNQITSPTQFILAGFKDQEVVAWVIDTQSFSVGWTGTKTFTIQQPGNYRNYRLYIKGCAGYPYDGGCLVIVSDLKFYCGA